MSALRWRTRIVLWSAAAIAGFAVVMFAKSAEVALGAFFAIQARYAWAPFMLAPGLGMLTVALTRRYFPGAEGSGIPQVIAATRLASSRVDLHGLVSPRIALGKIALGTLALIGGFSSGREGPSVQVSASILNWFHRYLPHWRAIPPADLILAGGAAGIAAAFNTPLAGIVFAVEELGKQIESRSSGVLISTIILAGLVSIATLGNYNYFGHLRVANVGLAIAVPVIAYGLVCGLLGGAFSKLLLLPMKLPDLGIWRWRARHPVAFAGLCGLTIAALGWAGDGLSYGSGYAITSKVVAGDISLPWHAPITRFLATVVTYFSGIPGGIFAPSLAIGAAVGATTSPLLGFQGDTVTITALCMAGFLAAVTQSPITAAIIVMEMIDGHEMVISLMAVCLIAKGVSAWMGPELYQQLAAAYVHRTAPQSRDAG